MRLRIKINSKTRLIRLCNKHDKKGLLFKDLKESYVYRLVENTDWYKSVLNKIIATCKKCIK